MENFENNLKDLQKEKLAPRSAKVRAVEKIAGILTPKKRKSTSLEELRLGKKTEDIFKTPSNKQIVPEDNIDFRPIKLVDEDSKDKVKAELFKSKSSSDISTISEATIVNQSKNSSLESLFEDKIEMNNELIKIRKHIDVLRDFDGKPQNMEKFLSNLGFVFKSLPADLDEEAIPTLLEYAIARLLPSDIFQKISEKNIRTFDSFKTILQETVYGALDLDKVNNTLNQMRQGNDETISNFAMRMKAQKPIIKMAMRNGNIEEATVTSMAEGTLFNYFMKNLHNDIRQTALAKDFKTIDEAVVGMEKLEKMTRFNNNKVEPEIDVNKLASLIADLSVGSKVPKQNSFQRKKEYKKKFDRYENNREEYEPRERNSDFNQNRQVNNYRQNNRGYSDQRGYGQNPNFNSTYNQNSNRRNFGGNFNQNSNYNNKRYSNYGNNFNQNANYNNGSNRNGGNGNYYQRNPTNGGNNFQNRREFAGQEQQNQQPQNGNNSRAEFQQNRQSDNQGFTKPQQFQNPKN